MERGQGGWIATANLDHLRRLQQPGEFRRVYEQADVVVADGMPVVWACRVQGTPVPERVAGSDLIRSLSVAAARARRSVYLLGGEPGTAEAAATRLVESAPGLVIAGTRCPPFGFERDPAQLEELRAALAAARPDVVFVALGSPKQELLIARLRDALPGAWWIGVGISFCFVAGTVRRAPRWLQRLGLEWLHRLVQEPRRLWARYLWSGPPFVVRLFAGALRGRLRGARREAGS
jgi:N-acetylglucosaminyldiphosphoundecaprenol N-acetyl-beta-D-mannosaminyltransferase